MAGLPALAHLPYDTRSSTGQAVDSESSTSTTAAAPVMGESIVRDSMISGESLTFKTASTPPDTLPIVDRLMERDLASAEEAREAIQPSAPSPSRTHSRREPATSASAT